MLKVTAILAGSAVLSVPTQVTVSVSGGTAIQGIDFLVFPPADGGGAASFTTTQPYTITIPAGASSAMTSFYIGGMRQQVQVSASNVDDDVAPTSISLTAAPTFVLEPDGGTVAVTATLNGAVASGSQTDVTVSVNSGTADSAPEALERLLLEGVASGFAVTGASVAIVEPLNLNVASVTTEGGGSGEFTLALGSAPSQNVTVTVTSSDTGEGTVSPAELTFTSLDWNAAQTVTVTGVDDAVADGDVAYTLSLAASSTDTAYNGRTASVAATNADNDAALTTATQVTVSVGSGTGVAAAIAGTDFTRVNDFIVTIAAEQTSGSGSFELTPRAGVADEGVKTLAVTGSVPAVTGLTVSGATIDISRPGLLLSKTAVTTGEDGSADTFTVALSSQPSDDVTVAVSSSDTGEGTAAPTSLTFTASDWNTAQTVTVTGADDALADGNAAYTINRRATSTDADYNAATASVAATNTDDDTAPTTVTLTAAPANVTAAGGAQTVTATLDGSPLPVATTVTVSVSGNGGSGEAPATDFAAVADFTVTIDAESQSGTGTFTLTPTADSDPEGTETVAITGTATSFSVTGTTVSIVGLGLNVSKTSITTTEAGNSDTFTVALLTLPPTEDVTVTSDDTGEGTVAPASLTFSTTNWRTAQMVIVTGVDDSVDDGNVTYTIELATDSIDTDYDGLTTSVPETGGAAMVTVTATLGGTVSLPTATAVTVSVGSGTATSGTDFTAVPNFTVTIAAQSFSAMGTFTLTPTADSTPSEGAESVSITGTAPGGLTVAAATVSIVDAGLSVSETNISTDEDGSAGTFTVALLTAPSTSVTVTAASNDATEGLVTDGASLTFTTTNWSAPQTVNGQDDNVDDGRKNYRINLAMASADAAYNGLTASVAATNMDDEVEATIAAAASTALTWRRRRWARRR